MGLPWRLQCENALIVLAKVKKSVRVVLMVTLNVAIAMEKVTSRIRGAKQYATIVIMEMKNVRNAMVVLL
jgi:hypothetical protein